MKPALLSAIALLGLLWLAIDNWPHTTPKQAPVKVQPLLATEGLPVEAFTTQRPTLVHFWATWCPTCMAEWPELMHNLPALNARMNVILINLDTAPPQRFYQQWQLAEPKTNLWLVHDPSHTITLKLLGSTALPANLITQGSPPLLQERRHGPLDWASFTSAMAEPPAAHSLVPLAAHSPK